MIILGLGSNEGDRLAHLREAVRLLAPFVGNIRTSAVYESKALLPPGAPVQWGSNFLNMAVMGDSVLTPIGLLKAVKDIERKMGRTSQGRWSPRVIDIDILAIDCGISDAENVQVPHIELLNRDFAMLPLAELAPGWQYPREGAFYKKNALEIVAEKEFRCGGNLQETGIMLYAD